MFKLLVLLSTLTAIIPALGFPITDMEQETNTFPLHQLEIQKLSESAPTLNKEVIELALRAYAKAYEQGDVKKTCLNNYRLFCAIRSASHVDF